MNAAGGICLAHYDQNQIPQNVIRIPGRHVRWQSDALSVYVNILLLIVGCMNERRRCDRHLTQILYPAAQMSLGIRPVLFSASSYR